MLKKENPLEQLDNVLQVFADKESENYKISVADISFAKSDTKAGEQISLTETEMILKKLIKDNYVSYEPQPKTNSIDNITEVWTNKDYALTFEGNVFLKQGGYSTSFQSALSENRIKNVKENLLIVGTWLAGIGAVALVVWEIYKKIYLHD